MVLFIIMWPFYATFSDFRFEIWAILCIVATNVPSFSDFRFQTSDFRFQTSEACFISALCANKWCTIFRFQIWSLKWFQMSDLKSAPFIHCVPINGAYFQTPDVWSLKWFQVSNFEICFHLLVLFIQIHLFIIYSSFIHQLHCKEG